jgi:hypothetical protein
MSEIIKAEIVEMQRYEQRALDTSISSALEAQVRARIEARYKLAIHRPRDMDKVRIALLKECDRPRFAEVARYSKPQGSTKVTGPSIRFVEAALRCLGNIATETTVTLDDDIRRVIRVEVTDLETNVTHPKEIVVSKEIERRSGEGREVVRERKNKAGITLYIVKATDDEIMLKESSMVSKALRQLGLRLIPGDLIDEAMETVVATQQKTDKTDPEAARKRVFDSFDSLGIGADALKKYLGHDVGPLDLPALRELYTAIKQGEVIWSDLMTEREEPKGLKETLKAKVSAAKPTVQSGTTPTSAQLTEAKRLRTKLDDLNPELAERLWSEHREPYTETQYQTLIEKLAAEVHSAEGGQA